MRATPRRSARPPARTYPRRPPRQNISRRAVAVRRQALLRRAVFGLKLAAGAVLVVLVSFFFIFVHDVFVQSDYFKAKRIQVEGGQRLSSREIMLQAGVREGVNILSVNLSAARRRLLAHPWIAAAEVQREIPSGLHIRIREQAPAAIVDLGPGRRFLLNDQGELFKEWEKSDPVDLPVVSGFKVSDARAVDRRGTGRLLPLSDLAPAAPPEPPRSRPLDAVMQVLALGCEQGSALPIRQIRTIQVDRELGITVVAFDPDRSIRLGYDDYPAKYHLLADLLAFFKAQPGPVDFDRIDLTDVNRVIVNPVKAELPQTGPQGG
jgi:cell division protein FtsQ